MVVSAMVTNYCNEDGTPTEKFMAYHEHKAKGGYGIIITEDFAVTRTAGASKTLAGLWEDRQIEPLRQLGGTDIVFVVDRHASHHTAIRLCW